MLDMLLCERRTLTICVFGSSEPMVSKCTTIVLGVRLGLRRAVRCAASPRAAGKLVSINLCSPPFWRLVPQVGDLPLPREGVDVGERRLPGVECVAGWEGCEPLARDFLNRLSPFKGYPSRTLYLSGVLRWLIP